MSKEKLMDTVSKFYDGYYTHVAVVGQDTSNIMSINHERFRREYDVGVFRNTDTGEVVFRAYNLEGFPYIVLLGHSRDDVLYQLQTLADSWWQEVKALKAAGEPYNGLMLDLHNLCEDLPDLRMPPDWVEINREADIEATTKRLDKLRDMVEREEENLSQLLNG